MHIVLKLITIIAIVILCTGNCWSANADTTYQIDLNTTPLSGYSGFVDLQFNPGGFDSLDASANISQVTTNGSLSNSDVLAGSASGMLPSGAVIENVAAYNDLFQGFTFGSDLDFRVTFSGSALSPGASITSSGSTFAVSLYGTDQVTPLLSTSSTGALALVTINPDGSIVSTTYPDTDGITHASVVLLPSTSVPEPGNIVLAVCLGLVYVGTFARYTLPTRY